MCEERISYWIPKGYDYAEVKVQCGRTDPHGGVALCEDHVHDEGVRAHLASVEADNAWLKSAGWGEI